MYLPFVSVHEIDPMTPHVVIRHVGVTLPIGTVATGGDGHCRSARNHHWDKNKQSRQVLTSKLKQRMRAARG